MLQLWEMLVRVVLQHSPISLDVGIEVSKIKAPWTGAAAVFDVRNRAMLNQIA